jgi:PEP-CTERM motif
MYAALPPTQPQRFSSLNDGATDVTQFNQNDVACGHAGSPNDFIDRNDWVNGIGPPCIAPPTPLVQDAIIFPGQVAAYGPGTPEFIALETLGYDPVPEPGTLALLGTSLLALLALRRCSTVTPCRREMSGGAVGIL